MDVPFCYKPLPVHEPFHASHATERAAIGAVGSGKTIALCGDAIWNALKHPGSRIMIARQTATALRDTTEAEFFAILGDVPQSSGQKAKSLLDLSDVTRSGGHTNTVTLPNGSEIMFRSLDDWRKHMSLNIAAVYVDEASEIDEATWIGLSTRIRQTDVTPMARRQGVRSVNWRAMALCTNPNGHDWIWERFVRPVELGEDPGDTAFFRSTSFDNPYLPADYLQNLLSMPETWLKRYVMCTFDEFEGQIYPFDAEQHVVTHFTPPPDWDRAMGLDWGLRNPTAVVWWARRPGTAAWVQYREWQTYDSTDPVARDSYQTMAADQVIARIRQIEHAAGERHIRYRVADPAVQQRSQVSGKSIDFHFKQAGMPLLFGMKRHEDRINALTRMLTSGQLKFSDNCPMTAIALQQYRWADATSRGSEDGPERPVKKNDHLVNAAEYLATHFMAAPKIEPERPKGTFNDELWGAVRKQQRRIARVTSMRPTFAY